MRTVRTRAGHPGPIDDILVRMSLTLCVLLWAHSDAEDALIAHEDEVLSFVAEHGGRVLQRARSAGSSGDPLKIQLLEFPSAAAVDDYIADGRRTLRTDERDRAIARTEVITVQLVKPG